MTSAPVPRPSLPPLQWAKPPQQKRSQETLERILDAAEEFITDRGVQALTVSAVVAQAKSSVGAFYARFPDKAALLSMLHERECDEALATADAALAVERWEDTSLSEAFEQIVSFVVQLFVERRSLVLAFKSLGATDQSFARRRARLVHQVAQCLHAFLVSRADEIPHRDLQLAADVCVRILFGTLESETTIGGVIAPGGPYAAEQLASELARAVLGYLGIPVSTRVPRRDLAAI